MNPQIKKWHEAHPEIDIPDAGLETMAPFPSLFANDFIAYLQSKGEHGEEVITFVRDLSRELVWAYGMVAKAQRDGDASRLLNDLLNNCAHGAEWAFTARFLRDYAKANSIALLPVGDGFEPSWMNIAPPTAAI